MEAGFGVVFEVKLMGVGWGVVNALFSGLFLMGSLQIDDDHNEAW